MCITGDISVVTMADLRAFNNSMKRLMKLVVKAGAVRHNLHGSLSCRASTQARASANSKSCIVKCNYPVISTCLSRAFYPGPRDSAPHKRNDLLKFGVKIFKSDPHA